MSNPDDELRALLESLDPLTRDALRRVLIHDQADRDAVSSQLLRYRDGHADDWADIIDFLTMHPEERRLAVLYLIATWHAGAYGWTGLFAVISLAGLASVIVMVRLRRRQ